MNHDLVKQYFAIVGKDVVWIKSKKKAKAGSLFGSDNGFGYIQGRFMNKSIYAHRLAWFLIHGEMPNGEIDHINGSRTDNRIENLRVVTRQENAMNNHVARSDNKLGVMGVQKDKKKYMTRVKLNGKVIRRGGFDTPEEAHAFYISLKLQLHSTFNGVSA